MKKQDLLTVLPLPLDGVLSPEEAVHSHLQPLRASERAKTEVIFICL